MWHFLRSKKDEFGFGKLTAEQLFDWECGAREAETFRKMYEQLKKWSVKIFFSDQYSVYRDFIPRKCLIQTKAEAHLIESDNFQQRHWFARFRRKTCCVSRSLEMIDLTVFLYEVFNVNKSVDIIICSPKKRNWHLNSVVAKNSA